MTNLVIIKDNQAMTTSRMVAATFEKQHKNVLQSIENLDCSSGFRQLNFQLSQFTQLMPTGGAKSNPEYNITRDGFTFLAMGYTGKRAAEFKEAYIKAFNDMEAKLKAPVVLENKYTIEDLIIAQANSIKELKEEVANIKSGFANQSGEMTLELQVGQTQLFPLPKLVSIAEFTKNSNFTSATLSYLGRLATAYSNDHGLEYEKHTNGNLYLSKAVQYAVEYAVSNKKAISKNDVSNGIKSEEILKIIALLKKNPMAQELKTIPIGKYKSYRGSMFSTLKNLVYYKIHKCSELRFNISATTRGWIKVRRVK